MPLPANFPDASICVLGLGYVGLTLAVAMADTGFRVHGIEVRDDVLTRLAAGEPHFWEPRLREKLQRVIEAGRLTFSRETSPGFDASVFVITVGTPLDPHGAARLDMVPQATRQLLPAMRPGALVILRSTVKLGTARGVVRPILDEHGSDYMLAMCPERTLEGRALIELHELPQIIGADDEATRSRCQMLFGRLTPTTVALSSLEAAEMVKLIDNTYRDVHFAFANEVATVCGAAGLSATEVIRAGRLGYPRTNVARPGPVGGPCLEKDPHILIESAQAYGVTLPITAASRLTNERQPAQSIALLRQRTSAMTSFAPSPRVALLGLAFKGAPATDDLRGSMARPILAALRAAYPTATILGFDAAADAAETAIAFDIEIAATIETAFDAADIVVIANNHDAFARMDISSMMRRMARPSVVYDFWNLFDDVDADPAADRVYIGLGSENFGR